MNSVSGNLEFGLVLVQSERMRRDLDLIRDILLKVEEASGPVDLRIADRDQAEVAYNARLAEDAGFLEAKYATQNTVMVLRLTFQGHEFLDSSRNVEFWEKAKTRVRSTTGTLTVEALKQVLGQLISHSLRF